MVILTDDDMAELPSTSSREIAVEKFVPTEQIDPMLFEKSYYLEPDKAATKPYVLLREALEVEGRVAIVTVSIRTRMTMAVLRVRDGMIVMQTMLWPDEVRAALDDLLAAGCDIVTITQYLRPSPRHHPVERWVRPEEFVEHQQFDGIELGVAAVHVVEQATRTGDQHVHAAAQVVDLRLHAGAAEDRGDVHPQMTAVGLEIVGHLHRELAGRHQDQCARLARALGRGFLCETLQQRQAEGSGLAGTGLGATQQVVAGQHQRDRLGLDGGRFFVADCADGSQNSGVNTECGKAADFLGHGSCL